MKNKEKRNLEEIELKNTEETDKNDDYNIPKDLSKYFQTIDLKCLSSYKNLNAQEINNNDTLYGNNYIKYFMKNKLLDKNKCCRERPKKLGNLYTYLFIRNQPLITIGTQKWYLVILFQFFLHFSFIFIHFKIIHAVFPYMRYMLTFFYAMICINHLHIVLFNAGIPSPDSFSKNALKTIKKDDRDLFEVCEICNIVVDSIDDVRHCTECNICVKKMDHHCYWTGKCIAKNNYLTFQLFTFMTLLYYVWYAIVLVVWCIIKMNERPKKI